MRALSGQSEELEALGGAGLFEIGLNTLSGTALAITHELDAVVFTATAAQPSITTTFTLSDVSSAHGTTRSVSE